jgi:hypothetical protein
MMDKPRADWLVNEARAILARASASEFVQVDVEAAGYPREAFSEGEEGTWVRAWVFVPKNLEPPSE